MYSLDRIIDFIGIVLGLNEIVYVWSLVYIILVNGNFIKGGEEFWWGL